MITFEQVKEMTPKEVSYHHIKELTQEAFEYVNDRYELNCCDKCGGIESTYVLIWTGYIKEEELETLKEEILDYTAVCLDCYNQFKNRR